MQPKDYMSSSHANWENIQIDSFTSWINQHLSERGLSVKDLSVDFQDGVLLINLLEILSGKKITRYVRSPKFLQHKIDNIMIAFGFMEKAFDIKVFGCNAKDIVDGNLKQTMGVIFLLIQKIKVNLHLDHLQEQQQVGETTNPNTQTNGATTTPSKPRFYRASMQVNAANRFSHISPNKDQSNTTITVPSTTTSTTIQSNTSTVASQPVSTIPTTVAAVTPTPTPTTTTTNVPTATNNSTTTSNVPTTTTTTTTAPIRILPTTGVSVSTIRSKFLFEGGTGNTSGGNEKYNTFSPSSTTASSSSSNTSSERVLKRTESGHLISGGLSLSSSNGGIHEPLQRTVSLIEIKLNDHQTKFYDLKKIIFMQSVIRGYLIRSKWRDVLAKYKQHLGEYKKHFKQNEKAYRGLIRVQAIVKGRIQRKKLFKMFPLYRRNEIVKEILSTEDKYVTSLAMVTTHYLKPSEAFLSTQQVRSIFSQIEIIHRYNSLILEKLVSRNKIWYSSGQKIGDIFIEMSAFLKVYTIYVNNYNNSIQTITECMEIPKFASLLEKNRNQFGLDLSAFLIAPIQRIPRYILLLQDLLKNTKESHPDHQDLSLALKKMKDVAEYVNEKKREAENLNQVLTIQSSLTGKFNNLAEPHRRYVKKGTLISNDKIHLYFLFNDLLVKTENKIVSKIRDSARLSNGGDKGHKSTYHSKEIINEGKSKYLNSFFLAGSSLVDSNPDGFTFQIIGVGDANELNNQLNNNNDDSPTLSFSPFSSSFASTFTNSLGANNNNNNNNVNNTSGNSGNVNNSNNNNNNNSLINVNSNGSSPLTTSGHGLNSSFGINSGNGISMPTTSIQLEALSLNEKMTWMGELDECIFQLLEKSRSKKRSLITDVDELTTVPFDISVVKDAEFSNILEKKHSEISWRSKKFYLKNTHLYYHRYSSTESPKEPTKIKCINLILCSVKLAQVVDHPHCFQLITPSRIYFFSCEDSTVLFQWISSIRLSIKKKLESLKDDNNINNFTSIDHHNHHNGTSSPIVIPIATHSNATGSLSASLGSSFLSQQQGLNTSNSNLAPLALSSQDSILNIPGNNYCAECGASDPSWVSINYGVVVCLDCSSIHKNLPEGNVKSVRSLSLAFSDIVKKQEGNTKANSKYEKNIPTGLMKPNPKDSYETKLSWIKAKYINNNFQQQNGDSTPTTTTTTTIHVNNDSTPTSPTLNSQPPATTTTTTTDNVKLENGRLTPTTNENNITTPNTPAATNGDNISNSSRPTTPTLNNPNEEEHIEGINLKSGTDTSNGKGTWSRGSSHTVTERKTSFLDKPRIPVKREHQGYLFKTSSPTSNNSSDWKKYLFVYKNDVLTYYKVSKKNKRKEKGIIDLFHSVKQESRPKQKYSFTLVTSQRLYFLASETEEEMKTWLDVLSSHTSH